MLQQTQVTTVLNKYYTPFLKKFPTITHLAKASRTEVLKAWEGLGYYRRAGFLHEAAKRAANGLPEDAEGLLGLPGIGRNTAHAILAFAHHRPVPILEANVKRVVARIFALCAPKDDELWQGAEALLNTKAPFDYNQAMMDLGALVCAPKAPNCPICPAHTICKGQANPGLYPERKAKKPVPTRHVTILVTEDGTGRLYLEARKDALLGGLYGFPQSPEKTKGKRLGHVVHTYTHFRLEGTVAHVRLPVIKHGEGWHTRAEIARLPLSRLDHKVLALLTPAATQAA